MTAKPAPGSGTQGGGAESAAESAAASPAASGDDTGAAAAAQPAEQVSTCQCFRSAVCCVTVKLHRGIATEVHALNACKYALLSALD